MDFKYIVAVVRSDALESLEAKLADIHIGGITLTKVRGYGGYKNLYTKDWLSDRTKIEIFVETSRVELLLNTLLETASADVPGTGIVAVMPVERFLHLRTRTETLRDLPI